MKADMEELRTENERLKAELDRRGIVWGLWDRKKQEWAIDQWLREPAILVFSTLEGAMEVASQELRHGVEWIPLPYVKTK